MPLPDGDNGVEQQLLPLYENSDDGAAALEDAYEAMQQLRQHPLNINLATLDELLTIPGITTAEATAIVNYRRSYGRFLTVEELDMIPDIEEQQSRYLMTVLEVVADDSVRWYHASELRKHLAASEHNITVTGTIPTYYRAGDRGASAMVAGNTNKYADTYLGDPVKHSLRYSWAIGPNLLVNLTGAKAAGEPFFTNGNGSGYDRYAFNIQAKDLGPFKQIVLGHFRAQFGMGLVLNNNLSFGKQAMLASVGRRSTVFTPHSSASDAKHFQGAALTVAARRLSLSTFFSYRSIDATLNADSTVASVVTSPYHRTAKEMAKKNNTQLLTTGLHASLGDISDSGIEWGVGLTALYTHFLRPLNPVFSTADTVSTSKLYRLYNATGSSFLNAAVDYKFNTGTFSITGETALADNGALATVNHLTYTPMRGITFTALQRYYSYKYTAFYASGISEGSGIQNETGALLGVHWAYKRRLTVDAYTDYAYFPWLRYRVSSSSYAWDNSLAASLKCSRWTFSARYRLKLRQQDATLKDDDGHTMRTLASRTTHRLRLTALLNNHRWSARSNVEGIMTGDNALGFVLSQAAGYDLTRRLNVYISAAYFNTDDYDTRVYSYERGMLYAFSNNAFYGDGMRLSLLLTADVARWLTVRAKIGCTKYFDRSVIGTAERQIFSSSQTDIDLQMAIKL